MKLGRFFGIVAVLASGTFTYLGYDMMLETGSVFKFFFAAPVFLFMGIAMIIFPGGNITLQESKAKTKDPNIWRQEAPKNHKIAWVVAGVIGFIASMILFEQI